MYINWIMRERISSRPFMVNELKVPVHVHWRSEVCKILPSFDHISILYVQLIIQSYNILVIRHIFREDFWEH